MIQEGGKVFVRNPENATGNFGTIFPKTQIVICMKYRIIEKRLQFDCELCIINIQILRKTVCLRRNGHEATFSYGSSSDPVNVVH